MKRLLVLLFMTLSSVMSFQPAHAAVPANGIYESHNGVIYSTAVKPGGCRYSTKFNVFGGTASSSRNFYLLGQYISRPASGCYVDMMARFWSPSTGAFDVHQQVGPNHNGDLLISRTLPAGTRFVFSNVTVYPAISGGVQFNAQVGVVYDANPCIQNNDNCNVVAGWRAADGVVR